MSNMHKGIGPSTPDYDLPQISVSDEHEALLASKFYGRFYQPGGPKPEYCGMEHTVIDIEVLTDPKLFNTANYGGPYTYDVYGRSRFSWVKLIRELDTPKYVLISKTIHKGHAVTGGKGEMAIQSEHLPPEARFFEADEVILRWFGSGHSRGFTSPIDLVDFRTGTSRRASVSFNFEIRDRGGFDHPWIVIRLLLPDQAREYAKLKTGQLCFKFESVEETDTGYCATITHLKRTGDDVFIALDEIPTSNASQHEASP